MVSVQFTVTPPLGHALRPASPAAGTDFTDVVVAFDFPPHLLVFSAALRSFRSVNVETGLICLTVE